MLSASFPVSYVDDLPEVLFQLIEDCAAAKDTPNSDILIEGFSYQAFSQVGKKFGFG